MKRIILDAPSHIYSYLNHLKIELQVLQQNKLYTKKFKCKFGCVEIDYLGHVITENGIAIDKKKLKSIASWPLLKTPKTMKGFLDLTGHYKKFIKRYGGITAALNLMLKKGLFPWTEASRKTFED